MKKKVTGKATHHEVAKRKARSRDGQKWSPTGGTCVTEGQKKGYSEGSKK